MAPKKRTRTQAYQPKSKNVGSDRPARVMRDGAVSRPFVFLARPTLKLSHDSDLATRQTRHDFLARLTAAHASQTVRARIIIVNEKAGSSCNSRFSSRLSLDGAEAETRWHLSPDFHRRSSVAGSPLRWPLDQSDECQHHAWIERSLAFDPS